MAKNLSPLDPSSFSRPEHAKVNHTHFNLTVDFDSKLLKGYVDLKVQAIDKQIKDLILDVSGLNIDTITCLKSGTLLKYDVSETVKDIGSKLTIHDVIQDDSNEVRIHYSTTPEASGLQWLEPSQTAGKKNPYLFSQFQAIHARSVFPCQDTPAVKSTYSATIQSPEVFTVLMSAICKGVEHKNGHKVFQFEQNVPIASYLVAIAVGVLESRKIGPRSHVWAEKEIIESAAYEFADTEHQLTTAEEICGPYLWGIYDLLILSPSFPFGGMENPCLTFVTPTVLAGDRSLANVIAHEIAHSWTGNLITNRNFEHFWLNEGFTVFIERKIKGRLCSPQDQDFDAFTAIPELRETVQRLGASNPLTSLVVNLTGINPDDAFSLIPYEKGHMFLRYIENIVGGPDKFEPFLREYFNHFKYKSIDTNDFVAYFKDYFEEEDNIDKIEWHRWLYMPGMPPIIPQYDTSKAEVVTQLKETLLKNDQLNKDEVLTQFNNLTVDQKIYLLLLIFEAGPLDSQKFSFLSSLGLDDIQNSEIKFLWFRICIAAHQEDKIQDILNWVNEIGRMKFVRPLYRDLYSWKFARPKAIKNFQKNRNNMMWVVQHGLLKDLHLSE